MSGVSCSCNGRHIIVGEPELHLSLGATSVANARQRGFLKVCAADELAIEIETDVKKKMRACRGTKQVVKSSNRKFELGYKTTIGNLGITELGLLFHGDGKGLSTARAALANVAGTAFNFDTGADGVAYSPGKWMELLDANGNRVRDIDALTVAGGNASYGPGEDSNSLVEGQDYELDAKLGLIAFKTAIQDDVITPTITAAAITATSEKGFMQGFKPGTKFTHRGIGHLFCFDDDETDNLAFKHEDFEFELTATSGATLGDDEFASFEVEITILNPQQGALYARPDVDVWGAVIS